MITDNVNRVPYSDDYELRVSHKLENDIIILFLLQIHKHVILGLKWFKIKVLYVFKKKIYLYIILIPIHRTSITYQIVSERCFEEIVPNQSQKILFIIDSYYHLSVVIFYREVNTLWLLSVEFVLIFIWICHYACRVLPTLQ